MGAYKTIKTSVEDAVAWVWMNRPEVFNAIDLKMAEELSRAMADAAADRSVRVVVLTGTGEAFSSGGDVKFFARHSDDPVRSARTVKTLAAHAHQCVSEIVRMPKPVIAAVNGVAAGAAFGFSLACDLTVAVESAQFMVAYTGVGLTPDAGTTYHLGQLVGPKKAKQILLLNAPISASAALELGIVNMVLPADRFAAGVAELSRRLAQGPTRVYGRTKTLVHRGCQETLETQMENERVDIAESARKAAFREGVTAFVQNRTPDFRSTG